MHTHHDPHIALMPCVYCVVLSPITLCIVSHCLSLLSSQGTILGRFVWCRQLTTPVISYRLSYLCLIAYHIGNPVSSMVVMMNTIADSDDNDSCSGASSDNCDDLDKIVATGELSSSSPSYV